MLENVLFWLDTHNGLVTAAATIVIALSAVLTTYLTRTLASENRLLRKAGTEPEVVVYLMPDGRFPTMVNFVLANIGRGPALNVEFTFDAHESDSTSHNVQLSNRTDRKAISVLPQDEKIVAFFGAGHELYRDPRLAPFKVRVDYKNILQKSRPGEFELDVSQFAGLISLGTLPEQELAQATKTIADKIGNWTSGFKRLKVEVITTEQAERNQQEALRAAQEQRNRQSAPSDSG
jgi:hypothetical protein